MFVLFYYTVVEGKGNIWFANRTVTFILFNKCKKTVPSVSYKETNDCRSLNFNYLVSVTAGGPVSPRG